MSLVVASGREIITTCDAPAISTVLAPIRFAMKRSSFVPIALSWPDTRYHEGIVFQADGPDGSPRLCRAAGRWLAAMTSVSVFGRSAAKISRKTPELM